MGGKISNRKGLVEFFSRIMKGILKKIIKHSLDALSIDKINKILVAYYIFSVNIMVSLHPYQLFPIFP